jgi:hypothetical protein
MPARTARLLLLISLTLLTALVCIPAPAQPSGSEDILAMIEAGDFRKADAGITQKLASDTTLSAAKRLDLAFEQARMYRIRKDFTKTETEVRAYVKKWTWAQTRTSSAGKQAALEMMRIDGENVTSTRGTKPLSY